MSAVQRVAISDDVAQLVQAEELAPAFAVMEAAFDVQQREQRPMTLQEALKIVAAIARDVEAIGV